MEKKQFIEAGEIVGTHGIKGQVKINPWADSPKFLTKFKTLYIDGKPVKVISTSVHKTNVIAELEGIDDINKAMTYKGKIVSINRDDAHLPKGSYFITDIIGSVVVDEEGNEIGKLVEVMERPASAIYVVKGEVEHLIPDVPEFVRNIDAENGIITVHLIEGM